MQSHCMRNSPARAPPRVPPISFLPTPLSFPCNLITPMKRIPNKPIMQGDSKKQKQQQKEKEEEKRGKEREDERRREREEEERRQREREEEKEKPTGREAAAAQTPLLQPLQPMIPMADRQWQQQYQQQWPRRQQQQPLSHLVVKAVGAATAGGSMLLLSALMLTATVIGLTVATPLLVICSPVLVPAAIGVFFLLVGFVSSGVLGLTAVSILSGIYKYVSGKQPPGAEQLEQAKAGLYGRARDIKDRFEHRIEQAQSS